MRLMATSIVLALTLLAGCSSGGTDEVAPTPATPSPSVTSPSPAPTTSEPLRLETLVLAPGAVGPVEAGMWEDEALETELLEPYEAPAEDGILGCEPPAAIQWKPEFKGLDVYAHNGTIISMGVFATGPQTAEGIGLGSTLADVQDVYGDVERHSMGYDQTGVLVQEGERWIGFLFNEPVTTVNADSKVTFIEVTRGDAPALIRDGC